MIILVGAVGLAIGVGAEYLLLRYGWLYALPVSVVILLVAFVGYTQGGFDGFEALTLMLAYSTSSIAEPLIRKRQPAPTGA
jgi:hypothetical protein